MRWNNINRVAITLVSLTAACAVGWSLWDYYVNEPWTRDGRVTADVVGVTPDVSGLLQAVEVRDNQSVRKGDVLLRIDPDRFDLALRLADAAVAGQKAMYEQSEREVARSTQLGPEIASAQKIEQVKAARDQANASYQQALANQGVARLNLERSIVRAPVNGVITNMGLRPGDYVSAGKAVMALVDSDTLRVDGYFEETKLAHIKPGDEAVVKLMGQSATPISGHVESIAGGIQDRERTAGPDLLANVNPSFSWVRLPQRVPVRIALEKVPENVRLVAGITATVAITQRPL